MWRAGDCAPYLLHLGYPNAYSYHLYHMTRIVWLGMDQPDFKKREIGSHRKFSSKGKNGTTIETFKTEMGKIFLWLKTSLRQGGHACFVVGNSIIRGESHDNAQVLKLAAESAGFTEVARLSRRRTKLEQAAKTAEWRAWSAEERAAWIEDYAPHPKEHFEVYWLPHPWHDPVVLVEGTDRLFYTWDGNHRIGVAFCARLRIVPAIVGFRMSPRSKFGRSPQSDDSRAHPSSDQALSRVPPFEFRS